MLISLFSVQAHSSRHSVMDFVVAYVDTFINGIIPELFVFLKIICQENFKNFDFYSNDNRYKENHAAKNCIKKLMFIQKLCQFI